MVGPIGAQTGFDIASLALGNQKGGVQGSSEERNESAAERIREANAQKGVGAVTAATSQNTAPSNVTGGQAVAGIGMMLDTRA